LGLHLAAVCPLSRYLSRSLYEKLRALGVGADGTSWLDLGTGTGILPQNMYNPNAKITGSDISEEQIRLARENAKENGWHIDYIAASAEKTACPITPLIS
jgi:2-polyprenyl-3-methyl-5-hydroxy-6-metoxy-1,4-benzoquinol methylase